MVRLAKKMGRLSGKMARLSRKMVRLSWFLICPKPPPTRLKQLTENTSPYSGLTSLSVLISISPEGGTWSLYHFPQAIAPGRLFSRRLWLSGTFILQNKGIPTSVRTILCKLVTATGCWLERQKVLSFAVNQPRPALSALTKAGI